MTEPQWQPNPFRGQRVLHLGCGTRPIRGAVNHDRMRHGEFVDVAWDLDRMPWFVKGPVQVGDDGVAILSRPMPRTWDPDPFDVILALDLFEHLVDPYGAVNECWDLLRPGGLLIIRVSAYDNPATYADMTHKHWANEEAYDFFDRSTRMGGHYSTHHPVDSLGRLPTYWRIDGRDRVNPDDRWPDHGDWQFTLVKLDAPVEVEA